MKKYILSISAALFLYSNNAFAQDIAPSKVPSVILNQFKANYPKASDIEWEKEGNLYKVDFEIGQTKDIEIWYDSVGKIVKKEEEISKGDLSKEVVAKINSDFNGYSIHDIKKISSSTETIYKMELKSSAQDWDIVIDSNGKIISQKED